MKNNIKINYFDIGSLTGIELEWMTKDIFPKLNIINYKAYSFEPNPIAYENLKKKFDSNKRITLLNYAINRYNGKCNLYLAHKDPGHSIFTTKKNVDPKKYIEVPCIKFSDWLLKQIPTFKNEFNIIRYNIEGAELFLLKDLLSTNLINYIHILAGAGLKDIKKVKEISKRHQNLKRSLDARQIILHPFCGGSKNENVNMSLILKQKLEEFYENKEKVS